MFIVFKCCENKYMYVLWIIDKLLLTNGGKNILETDVKIGRGGSLFTVNIYVQIINFDVSLLE